MKKFTFVAVCSYGPGDYGESYVDMELTDEEAALLIKYGTKEDVFYDGFWKCEELKILYQKVYDVAVGQITSEIKYGDWLDEEAANDPDWKADMLYPCEVCFPEEFEKMLSAEQ